ncbi:hypothetical protein AXG93_4201s1220 [Marchantia polymorpha subsp. ruderalis]|uniref:Uncharacterized protein n=1 Tax=Marchantia polymorpha subsp. ruderalis TaxID=1480154 RepID=A0A176WCF7_MARPO|nr:hypothetical protein AXG93_4201s1220 [Marchantia polymorpha subsp. ruderalis]
MHPSSGRKNAIVTWTGQEPINLLRIQMSLGGELTDALYALRPDTTGWEKFCIAAYSTVGFSPLLLLPFHLSLNRESSSRGIQLGVAESSQIGCA